MIRKLMLLLTALGFFIGCADNCSPVSSDGSYSCSEPEENYEEEDYADYDDDGSEGSFVIHISGSSDEEADYYDECYAFEVPDNCYSRYGTWSNVLFRVGSNQGRMPVKVVVYEGSYPHGDILAVKRDVSFSFSLDLNAEQVAAVAFYVAGKDTIAAVDGAFVKINKEETCGYSCYSAEDVTLDLRLED